MIDIKQINQTELTSFVSGLLINSSTGLFGAYLLTSGVYFGTTVTYASGVDQTISGQKTFSINPNVPYSGTTGQAPSLQFVLDKFSSINLNGILNFSGGSTSSYFYVPAPTVGSGVVNINYLNTLNFATLTGSQTFSASQIFNNTTVFNNSATFNGATTFNANVGVPTATGGSQPVTFSQFYNSGSGFNTRITTLEGTTGNVNLSRAIQTSFYQRTIFTGFNIFEQYVGTSGYYNSIQLHSRTVGDTDISGVIYFEDNFGNRADWAPFVLTAFTSFGSFNPSSTGIGQISRMGYDLSGGYSGMSGLAIGVYGYLFPQS